MNQNELKKLYSDNLKQIKKRLGLTTVELAEKLSIPSRTVGSYERQENLCSAQIITELCQKLNINANWFCTGQGEMFNAPKYEDVQDEFEKRVEEILKKKGLMK